MYDLQPPFLGPRRVHRSSLKPEDAAAMMVQRRHSQRIDLAKVSMFYPTVAPLSPMTRWRGPDATDSWPQSARSESPEPTPRFLEYSSRSLPEVSKPIPAYMARVKTEPRPVDFASLPDDILDCVLEQLRQLHNGRLSSSCPTCYMRNLTTVQLTSKSWGGRARIKLYSTIDICGEDSAAQLKRNKMQRGSRLRLLRRTLREQPDIADLVRELSVPDPDIPLFLPNGQSNPEFDDYRNLVASVVMAVPNLERLRGLCAFYNHEFDRLTQALSTRRALREHCWVITENDAVTARSHVQISGLLDDSQVKDFLYYNSWPKLETLMMCSPGGTGVIEHHVFVRVMHSLTSLKRLCVSSFDADDFTDATLLALPALEALRLEECFGVTDSGLSRWAARPGAEKIKCLSLIHQNVYDLLTLSKLFACLRRLVKLTIVQSDVTPALPADTMVIQPVLASSSLRRLHWDIVADEEFLASGHDSPNEHLALSILHAGFPKLRSLRAPRDLSPPGALQAVCQPAVQATVLLPADKFVLPTISDLLPSPSKSAPSRGNSLRTARIRAQGYIDANQKQPKEFLRVLITDHSTRDSFDDDFDSVSSSNSSGAGTEGTDPNDLFTPTESKPGEFCLNQDIPSPPIHLDMDHRNPRRSATWPISRDGSSLAKSASSQVIPIPHRSPLRPKPIEPLKVFEFSMPSFVGRISTSVHSDIARPPIFNLKPDVYGYDINGGVIGWGDLLRVSEKARPETENGKPWIRDGCSGAWNKGQGKSPEFWKHTERARRRIGMTIEVDHFF